MVAPQKTPRTFPVPKKTITAVAFRNAVIKRRTAIEELIRCKSGEKRSSEWVRNGQSGENNHKDAPGRAKVANGDEKTRSQALEGSQGGALHNKAPSEPSRIPPDSIMRAASLSDMASREKGSDKKVDSAPAQDLPFDGKALGKTIGPIHIMQEFQIVKGEEWPPQISPGSRKRKRSEVVVLRRAELESLLSSLEEKKHSLVLQLKQVLTQEEAKKPKPAPLPVPLTPVATPNATPPSNSNLTPPARSTSPVVVPNSASLAPNHQMPTVFAKEATCPVQAGTGLVREHSGLLKEPIGPSREASGQVKIPSGLVRGPSGPHKDAMVTTKEPPKEPAKSMKEPSSPPKPHSKPRHRTPPRGDEGDGLEEGELEYKRTPSPPNFGGLRRPPLDLKGLELKGGSLEHRSGSLDYRGGVSEPRGGTLEPRSSSLDHRGAGLEPRGPGSDHRGERSSDHRSLESGASLELRGGSLDSRGEPRGGSLEPRGGSLESRGSLDARGMERERDLERPMRRHGSMTAHMGEREGLPPRGDRFYGRGLGGSVSPGGRYLEGLPLLPGGGRPFGPQMHPSPGTAHPLPVMLGGVGNFGPMLSPGAHGHHGHMPPRPGMLSPGGMIDGPRGGGRGFRGGSPWGIPR